MPRSPVLPQNQTKSQEGLRINSDFTFCRDRRDAQSAENLSRLAQTLNLHNELARAGISSFDQTNPGTVSYDPSVPTTGGYSRPKQGVPLKPYLIRVLGCNYYFNYPDD